MYKYRISTCYVEHRVLCHHNCGYHIESLLYPSLGQRDLISASEAIWLHNIVEQSAMYSASTVLRETLDCFLLNHELIAELKAYTWFDFPVLDTSIPICICVAIKSILMATIIVYTKVYSLFQICFAATRWTHLGWTRYWLKVLTAKQMSGLVFVRYINDPMICL